jgi:hypothetical protein
MFRKIVFLLLVIVMVFGMAACGSTEPEPAPTLPPPEQVVVVTATPNDAVPTPIQITVPELPDLATSTPTPPVPTIDPAMVTAVHATIVADQATETAMPDANNGGLSSATEVPSQAPVITNFFASSAPQGSGIRYYLNYDVVNADRVEIFGHVMDNPQTGTWPVYNESNHWVLWAANSVTWVEQPLDVQPDHSTGSVLSDISLGSGLTTVCIKDPQFVDGDMMHVLVNGIVVLNNYQTGGREACGTTTFNSGPNLVEVRATNEGQSPLVVVQVSFTNVVNGAPVQVSQALKTNEVAQFVVNAP